MNIVLELLIFPLGQLTFRIDPKQVEFFAYDAPFIDKKIALHEARTFSFLQFLFHHIIKKSHLGDPPLE